MHFRACAQKRRHSGQMESKKYKLSIYQGGQIDRYFSVLFRTFSSKPKNDDYE